MPTIWERSIFFRMTSLVIKYWRLECGSHERMIEMWVIIVYPSLFFPFGCVPWRGTGMRMVPIFKEGISLIEIHHGKKEKKIFRGFVGLLRYD